MARATIGGYSQPKDPTGLTNKLSVKNMKSGLDSATGKKSAEDAQGAIDRDAGAAQAEIEKKLKERPAYRSAMTPDGKGLADPYKQNAVRSNAAGLEKRMGGAKAFGETKQFGQAQGAADALNARAMGTGPSKWAQARMDQVDSQAGMQRNEAREEGARSTATGLNTLSQQGGLGGGSRERMMTSMNRDKLRNSQGISAQAGMNKLGVTADDEAQRMQLQQSMPGVYGQLDQASLARQSGNNQLSMDKANMWGNMAGNERVGNQGVARDNQNAALGDLGGNQQYDDLGFQTGMAAFGAGKTADVQAGVGVGPKKRDWYNPMSYMPGQ